VATIGPVWDWAIYGALIVGALAVVAAAVFLVVHVLQGWRALKRLRRHVARELMRLADLGEVTADKAGAATDTAELERSLGRLRVDLARVAVLRAAIDEARGTFDRVAWVIPRK
jgi:uncharacterized membrane protein YcjF (UPF0283 family)